eukprot:955561-Rhodomonas_salina.1
MIASGFDESLPIENVLLGTDREFLGRNATNGTRCSVGGDIETTVCCGRNQPCTLRDPRATDRREIKRDIALTAHQGKCDAQSCNIPEPPESGSLGLDARGGGRRGKTGQHSPPPTKSVYCPTGGPKAIFLGKHFQAFQK